MKNIETKTIASGKFLTLGEITYLDSNGNERKWECCQRSNMTNAVSIIPIKKPSNTLVLIREYRPPVGRYCVGFPAGLIDENEQYDITAKRELLEETGYTASDVFITWPTENSAGMTGELCIPSVAYIDENAEENKNAKQNLQDNEEIEIFEVPMNSKAIYEFVQERIADGDIVSTKLTHLMIGLDFK